MITSNQLLPKYDSKPGKDNAPAGGRSMPSRTIVHPKLEMTTPDSEEEKEADAVASDIMAGGKVARSISGGGQAGGIAVSSQMESQLGQLQGQGQPMPEALRGMMERGFGRDFSQVRLHTDGTAAEMSSSISAKAFTHGNDIYFGHGQYSPSTTEGQQLVAHELTHVAQNSQKVARDRDINAENKIVDFYFYGMWNWGVFYHFLESNYPQVITKRNLKRDTNRGWEDDYGIDFLKDVALQIVDIEWSKLGKKNSNYERALAVVIKLFSVPPSSQLSRVFGVMKQIVENKYNDYSKNSNYLSKLRTTSFNEAEKYRVDGDVKRGVSFQGTDFDNRSTIQISVFNVAHRIDHELASKYFEDVDSVEKSGKNFRKQIEGFTAEWVHNQYDNDMKNRSGSKMDKPSMESTFPRLKKELLTQLKNTSNKEERQIFEMIYYLVESRQNNLYKSHLDTSNLVPAEVWTKIFTTVMKIELSIFFGAPAFNDLVAGIVGKAITNEVAAELFTNISISFIDDTTSYLLDTMSLPKEELEKKTLGDLAKDGAFILLQNVLSGVSSYALKSLGQPLSNEKRSNDTLAQIKNNTLQRNQDLFEGGFINKSQLNDLQRFVEESPMSKNLHKFELQAKGREIAMGILSDFTDKTIETALGMLRGGELPSDGYGVGKEIIKFALTTGVPKWNQDLGAIFNPFVDNAFDPLWDSIF